MDVAFHERIISRLSWWRVFTTRGGDATQHTLQLILPGAVDLTAGALSL